MIASIVSLHSRSADKLHRILRCVRRQIEVADAVFSELQADGEQPTFACRVERDKLIRKENAVVARIEPNSDAPNNTSTMPLSNNTVKDRFLLAPCWQ